MMLLQETGGKRDWGWQTLRIGLTHPHTFMHSPGEQDLALGALALQIHSDKVQHALSTSGSENGNQRTSSVYASA